ncbi:MAG: cytochrome ubiquinol oxidase subunit I [Methylobacteriaceae bacterium]|nr:cytochrome ubiquinol oxidase subunit I [Methylobacteriaceae bacterium]MBV9221044.1 cytochrome ubiquinol oxidase subunit I [Methylobacteriaceae bacterium]MBV9244899.1 cytochrome ubiquinol oxidase subunit I [Methylobacteriaceae bacterium]
MTAALDVVQLSRLQFGLTAMYHFLFVPLTLGLAVLLAIMESVYVMTGREIWRRMTKFWGVLFGINFAMGVATGITMEFQFGMNWAYYSHYVGDVFGAPLAIEGLMAFFLEATFIGLFFFGWDRLSKVAHLVVTWLVALGSNLSALWILVANGWMQHPVGARFNPDTMRMEVTDFMAVIFNPVAQAKFVHTVSAGYVTGAVFVLAISALYLLRGRHVEIAKRSATVAASFGLAAALSVVVLGDESGYTAGENQKMKIAAIEAMWDTEAAPASFTVFGLPNQETHKTDDAVEVPWVLGLIATRSINTSVPGIKELVARAEQRIRSGLIAYGALEKLRAARTLANEDAKRDAYTYATKVANYTLLLNADADDRINLESHADDLGYALLLKKIRPDIVNATDADIAQAAWNTVPPVSPLFWSFRVMVGLGFFFIAMFVVAFYLASARKLLQARTFLWIALGSLPLPWIAAELGWYVAEVGRQPWVIEGVLPTFLAVSSISASNVLITLVGFIVFYSALAIVDVYLMAKAIRLGPGMEQLRTSTTAMPSPITIAAE